MCHFPASAKTTTFVCRGLLKKSPTPPKLSESKEKGMLPFLSQKKFQTNPVSVHQSGGIARPPSEREGDHEVVEGACATKKASIKYGYRAQTLWINSDFPLHPKTFQNKKNKRLLLSLAIVKAATSVCRGLFAGDF